MAGNVAKVTASKRTGLPGATIDASALASAGEESGTGAGVVPGMRPEYQIMRLGLETEKSVYKEENGASSLMAIILGR